MCRFNHFIDSLILFSQPHMRTWSLIQRHNRRPENNLEVQRRVEEQPLSIHPSTTISNQTGTDQGFIQPDWALIFMLRMGLMCVQMMHQPGRSLGNIGMPV